MLKELGFEQTALGEITLRLRHDGVLGRDVHEIKLNDEFLMSSAFTDGEIALADIALSASEKSAPNVMVGGLGLGYTAQAALVHPSVQSVTVVEALSTIIGWHRDELLPLGPILMADARCRIVEKDFFALAVQENGFTQASGHPIDILLLDIDHSPRHRLIDDQVEFYCAQSLSQLHHQLTAGGIFAMWSNDAADQAFIEELSQIFTCVDAEEVHFANPYSGGQASNTIYIAKK